MRAMRLHGRIGPDHADFILLEWLRKASNQVAINRPARGLLMPDWRSLGAKQCYTRRVNYERLSGFVSKLSPLAYEPPPVRLWTRYPGQSRADYHSSAPGTSSSCRRRVESQEIGRRHRRDARGVLLPSTVVAESFPMPPNLPHFQSVTGGLAGMNVDANHAKSRRKAGLW